jgi:hypothetical protein
MDPAMVNKSFDATTFIELKRTLNEVVYFAEVPEMVTIKESSKLITVALYKLASVKELLTS